MLNEAYDFTECILRLGAFSESYPTTHAYLALFHKLPNSSLKVKR